MGKSQSYTFCDGDSILLNALNYQSGHVQWQKSTDSIQWENIAGGDTLSKMIYPSESAFYRLKITDSMCLPPYTTEVKYFEIIAPPTAYAGSSQSNITGGEITLNADTVAHGSGTWSILSGGMGQISDIHNPQAVFTGLPDSTYTLRWTVQNQCGTSYDEITLGFAPFSCGDILVDSRDGQMYPTVLIGNQCWMAKNLNIGQKILLAQNQTDNQTIEKYCYSDDTTYCHTYGGLYQWGEMMQYTTTENAQGICPDGWHIPSDEAWKTLEITLGMDSSQADMVNQWRGPGVGTALKAGGSSEIEILLGGCRILNGLSYYEGDMGYYWTSSQYGSQAWRRCFSATSGSVGRYNNFTKTYGLSVRCVKD